MRLPVKFHGIGECAVVCLRYKIAIVIKRGGTILVTVRKMVRFCCVTSECAGGFIGKEECSRDRVQGTSQEVDRNRVGIRGEWSAPSG